MAAPYWLDSKLIIFGITVATAGVLAYGRLEALGASVDRVQTSIDEQGDGLSEHIASPDHTVRGIKVAALESDQAKIETKIEQIDVRQQRMERNQVRMCLAWGVKDCE